MASSKIVEICTAVQTIVAASTGWSKVYIGSRIRADWKVWLTDFAIGAVPAGPGGVPPATPAKYQGAEIDFGQVEETALTNVENEIRHHFIVRAIRGAGESNTGVLLRQELEAIQQAIRQAHTPAGTDYEFIMPVTVSEQEQRIFGGVVCHYAELRFWVNERVARN